MKCLNNFTFKKHLSSKDMIHDCKLLFSESLIEFFPAVHSTELIVVISFLFSYLTIRASLATRSSVGLFLVLKLRPSERARRKRLIGLLLSSDSKHCRINIVIMADGRTDERTDNEFKGVRYTE